MNGIFRKFVGKPSWCARSCSTTNSPTVRRNVVRKVKTYTTSEIIQKRKQYMAPSPYPLHKYEEPMVIQRGKYQHLWDKYGDIFVDFYGQNLRVSLGYGRPELEPIIYDQMKMLSSCIDSKFSCNENSILLAEDLINKIPEHSSGDEWRIMFTNTGRDALFMANDIINYMGGTKTNNKIVLADETETGLGRTGMSYWNFISRGEEPDIIVIGDGLCNGVASIGAIIQRKSIFDENIPKIHEKYKTASPVACAVARKVLDIIDGSLMINNAMLTGGLLKKIKKDMRYIPKYL